MDLQLVCTDLGRSPEVKTLLGRATARTELSDGIAVDFTPDDATARTVLEFVLAERCCCAHFVYEIRFTPEAARLTLVVRASGDYLEALKAMYGP